MTNGCMQKLRIFFHKHNYYKKFDKASKQKAYNLLLIKKIKTPCCFLFPLSLKNAFVSDVLMVSEGACPIPTTTAAPIITTTYVKVSK